jgi:hypothetical protein
LQPCFELKDNSIIIEKIRHSVSRTEKCTNPKKDHKCDKKGNIVREAEKEIEVCSVFIIHGEKRNACKLLDVKTFWKEITYETRIGCTVVDFGGGGGGGGFGL